MSALVFYWESGPGFWKARSKPQHRPDLRMGHKRLPSGDMGEWQRTPPRPAGTGAQVTRPSEVAMSKYVCACVCVPQWQRETAPLPRRRVTEGRGMPSMLSALQSPFVQGDPALRVLQRSSVDNQPIDTKKVNSQDRGKKEGGGGSSFLLFYLCTLAVVYLVLRSIISHHGDELFEESPSLDAPQGQVPLL